MAHEIVHILNRNRFSHHLSFNSVDSDFIMELNASKLIPYYADERSKDHIGTTQFMDYFESPAHLDKTVVEES